MVGTYPQFLEKCLALYERVGPLEVYDPDPGFALDLHEAPAELIDSGISQGHFERQPETISQYLLTAKGWEAARASRERGM